MKSDASLKRNVDAISVEQMIPKTERARTILPFPPYAYHVDSITTGFIIGAAVKKAAAAGSGIPFFTSERKTGTDAQSQTGRKKPPRTPKHIPRTGFRGNTFCRNPSGTITCTTAENIIPSSRKGTASSHVPVKSVSA